jgi:hypothetical protein
VGSATTAREEVADIEGRAVKAALERTQSLTCASMRAAKVTNGNNIPMLSGLGRGTDSSIATNYEQVLSMWAVVGTFQFEAVVMIDRDLCVNKRSSRSK